MAKQLANGEWPMARIQNAECRRLVPVNCFQLTTHRELRTISIVVNAVPEWC